MNLHDRNETMFFTWGSGEKLLDSFVSRLRTRWPDLRLSIELYDEGQQFRNVDQLEPYLDRMAKARSVFVWCFRDLSTSRLWWDDECDNLDLIYHNLVEFHFRKRTGVRFSLAEVDEVQCEDASIGKVNPYPAILCTPHVLEVQIITPTDPPQAEFAEWVKEQTIEILLQAQKPG